MVSKAIILGVLAAALVTGNAAGQATILERQEAMFRRKLAL